MLAEQGRMPTGVSGGSGAPSASLCQASGIQNGKQFLFPEMPTLWYIITATTESQHILWERGLVPLYLLEDARRFKRLPLFCVVGKVTGMVTEKPKLKSPLALARKSWWAAQGG